MGGLFLLYFIAKAFYKLAEEYSKNKWLFAITSIAIYYLGTFLSGMIIAIVSELVFKYPIDNIEDIVLSIMAMPFGLLTVWLLYKFLEKKWKNTNQFTDSDILDENINKLI